MSPYAAAVSGGARSLLRMPSAGSRTRAARRMLATTAQAQQLVITRPDDWHLHVRDGDGLKSVVPHTAAVFKRAVIMPNLTPPVTSADQAQSYKQRILSAVPAESSSFTPLMTCYLTDNTTPEDVVAAKEAGVVAYKLYPAGATTNSDSGVTSFDKVLPALKAIAQQGMLLLVHGEVTDAEIDIFDREAIFITEKLIPILDKLPELKVVMEHITTRQAAEFVASASNNVAASITPQHILLNRNSLFVGGLRPHNYCLPVLKREEHRVAVLEAAASGNPRFFLGTDSAPHPVGAKESACGCAGIYSAPVALPLYAHAFEKAGALDKLEAFASFHGPDFYGLPRNTETVTLERKTWMIPDSYKFGETEVRPMWAGLPVEWSVVA